MGFKDLMHAAKELVLIDPEKNLDGTPIQVSPTTKTEPKKSVIPDSTFSSRPIPRVSGGLPPISMETESSFPSPVESSLPTDANTADNGGKFADDLKKQTDFDTTPIALQIKEITDALPASLQPREKFVTALKLGVKSGVTINAVLNTIDDLHNKLEAAGKSFHDKSIAFQKDHIDNPKQLIEQKAAQISDLEKQIAQLKAEQVTISVSLADDQNKLIRRSAWFEVAYNKRSEELVTLEAYYKSFSQDTTNVSIADHS